MAEICQSFSAELNGLVSAASAWVALTRRHAFECPEEAINIIDESVLDLLAPQPAREEELPREPPAPLVQTAIICPEDRPDMDECDSASEVSETTREERKHITEVFLPDVCSQSE